LEPIARARRFLLLRLAGGLACMALLTSLAVALNAPAGAEAARTTKGSALGGPFTLTDHTGSIVTDKTFRGQYMLVYFGYMSCPDVCPTDLANMAAALDSLGPVADRIQPLFISVDPKRDTVERLADYVGLFHPRLIGLTGTREQIDKVTKAYLVSYFLFDSQDTAEYEVAHTAKTFLMAPDGRYLMWFRNASDPALMAAAIRRMVEKWSGAKGAK